MNNSRLRRSWLYPLVFFQIYLATTVFLLFYGPWPWVIKNSLDLVTYLVVAQISILLGYVAAWPSVQRNNSINNNLFYDLNLYQGERYIRQALFITFVLYIPTSLSRTGQLLPNLVEGLADTGLVYNNNYARLLDGNKYIFIEYLRMIFSPWLISLFPLTVVYWPRLPILIRVGCAVAIFANLSIYIATGTNKGLADFLVTGPWLIYLAFSVGILKFKITRNQILLILIISLYAFLQFFGSSQLKREGGVGEFGVFNTGDGLIFANPNLLGPFLSDNFRIIYESLTRYLVQGYYALSLALKVDGPSTFGFGSSMFLARNIDAEFQTNYFTKSSVPGILEDQFGWSMTALWHSIYPWLLSDFGVIGSIIFIGLMAYLLSLSWGLSLCTLSYRWITIAFMMLILFFYIPANNQIFQTGETFCGFVLVMIGILISQPKTRSGFDNI